MASQNWDDELASEGMVHQSVANTDNDDATKLKQGYDYQNFSEIAPTPVACWPLHEDSGTTAHDVTGNGNDGTYNGPTLGQEGILGTTAPGFDGTNDYVDIPATGLPSGTGNFTFVLWAKRTAKSDAVAHLWGNNSGNEAVGLSFRSDGDLRFVVWGDDFDVATPFDYDDGEWRQYAGVHDSGTVELFADADSLGSASRSPDINLQAGRIGSNFDTFGGFLSGAVADVRIYDGVLSQSQLQALYDVVDTPGDWLGNGVVQ